MPAFHLIQDHLHHWDETLLRVGMPVDRLTLEKRRWRGLAEDGVEFGFDLEHALADGDVFYADERAYYQIEQKSERVIAIDLAQAGDAARIGWMVGNLHFKIAVVKDAILAPDDPAIHQLLEREGIAFQITEAVFRPLRGGHAHGH